MNYQDFCTKMTIFTLNEDMSSSEKRHFIEFTKSFFADCYLHENLSNLITQTESKQALAPDYEKDLDTALIHLFGHYPLCNIDPREKSKKPRFAFNTKQAIADCIKWFTSLYANHSQLCQKLFPVITFILGDSYEYLYEESVFKTDDEFQKDLYEFICENLSGKNQQKYLYSLLTASTAKRKSCLAHGETIISSFEKKCSNDWYGKSYIWKLPVTKNSPNPYRNTVDYHLHKFFQLLEDCKIRNNLSSYRTERTKIYESYAARNDYDNNDNSQLSLPLMGENFVALLHYLQDFDTDVLQNTVWAGYDRSLSMYALSQMTSWITPFTTKPTQYIMPLYNPFHPLTCDYFNQKMMTEILSFDEPMWEYSDFSSSFMEDDDSREPLAYISDFYEEFLQWYSHSSGKDQQTFDDYMDNASNILFEKFISCKYDYIYIPTEKDLRFASKTTSNLGYFYCLCDYFISYQLPGLLPEHHPTIPDLKL